MKVCWKYTPAMGASGPMPRHVAQAKGELGPGNLAWLGHQVIRRNK